MLGDVVRLADNLWFIQGEMPPDASRRPDWCNVVIYRVDGRVYLIDSSGGPIMRSSIEHILTDVGEIESLTLINTHGHLDHICNNDLIQTVPAMRRRHLLCADAIDFVQSDFAAHMAEEFDYLATIYEPFDSYQTHRRLYRLAALLRDSLGRMVGRRQVLHWLFRFQFRKFNPVRDSQQTMRPLEEIPSESLRFGEVEWTGWTLGEDDVRILRADAHMPGDVVIYIPEHQMLCAGDVTFPLFPTFRESSRDRILDCLTKILRMARDGHVDVLADGHGNRCYTGRLRVESLLEEVIGDHLAFEQILRDIFTARDGLTPGEVYDSFTGFADRPGVVNRYLSLEFPHTPPSLQNVMVTTMLQLGFQPRGPKGRKRFYRPN